MALGFPQRFLADFDGESTGAGAGCRPVQFVLSIVAAGLSFACSEEASDTPTTRGGGEGGSSAASTGAPSSATTSGDPAPSMPTASPSSGAQAGAAAVLDGTCSTDETCPSGLQCCDEECVLSSTDPRHCGACGIECEGATPFCNNGTCIEQPCQEGTDCEVESRCCGVQCCAEDRVCCLVIDIFAEPGCVIPPEDGSCPYGCLDCDCAAADTPVATPEGERRIADLRIGDRVYSVQDEGIVVVPIERVRAEPVFEHTMVRVATEDGRWFSMSASHPTADGRLFGSLESGDELAGVTLSSVERVPYSGTTTHDVLPASSTGIYFVASVPVGSTLRWPATTR